MQDLKHDIDLFFHDKPSSLRPFNFVIISASLSVFLSLQNVNQTSLGNEKETWIILTVASKQVVNEILQSSLKITENLGNKRRHLLRGKSKNPFTPEKETVKRFGCALVFL